MANSPNLNAAAIALNRFGLGARADETPPADPKAWLLAQFDQYQPRPAAWASQPDSVALSVELAQHALQLKQARDGKGTGVDQAPQPAQRDARSTGLAGAQPNMQSSSPNAVSTGNPTPKPRPGCNPSRAQPATQAERKAMRGEILDLYRASVNARVASALTTSTPFIERLVHFWANHFAVSTEKPAVAALAGSFEAEAIRPHVLGRFEDMLVAVERHPAMQLFLDQTRSVGPDSMAALRAAQRNPDRKRGLNENLAREIMELHTLGVRSGYSQDDVTEFARALTGWSVAGGQAMRRLAHWRCAGNPRRPALQDAQCSRTPNPAPSCFAPRCTSPARAPSWDARYDQPGEEQALAILHDLASAPATAQHIGGKLARHFVADNPPPDVSEQLASVFERSGGDLPSVYRALIDHAASLVAHRGEVQDAVGVDHFFDARARLARPRQSAERAHSHAARSAGVASRARPPATTTSPQAGPRPTRSCAGSKWRSVSPRASATGSMHARSARRLLAGSLSAPTATAVSRAESASDRRSRCCWSRRIFRRR